MQSFIGVTDFDWYRQLSARTDLDEVNFWKPGGRANFRALPPGGLFLFKLHAPHNAIVGGGFFGHFSKVPVSLAWDAFGAKNGVRDLGEFRRRIEQYRRGTDGREDYTIGCILLEEPFFLPRDQWIPQPADWQPNVVQGAGYDLSTGAGRVLWDALQERLGQRQDRTFFAEATRRFGEPTVVLPRLGQGTFRVAVTDAYDRRCAITGERTLPVLQAAHIHPYADGGPHRVPNGLLLRSDLHTLFDRGYVTVTPQHVIEVSGRIREEFDNGRDYYQHHGKSIRLPAIRRSSRTRSRSTGTPRRSSVADDRRLSQGLASFRASHRRSTAHDHVPMGFRFRRSIRLLPGVRVNLSKSGPSVSVGRRGASVTVGPRGTHANVGIPGTGMSWRERIDAPDRDAKRVEPPRGTASAPGSTLAAWVLVLLALAACWAVRR